MDVSELFRLTGWVEANIASKPILKRYNQLQGILEQNSRGSSQQPFEEVKISLYEALNAVPVDQLTHAQTQVLETIGIRDKISKEGVDQLENILVTNVIDSATAFNKVRDLVSQLSQGIDWSKATRSHLQRISSAETFDEVETGDVLLRVTFTKAADIKNVVDLSNWSESWFIIARGISVAIGSAPEDVRVVGASKGSFIVDLVGATAFAKAISYILKEVLERIQQVIDMRVSLEQLKKLKIENNKAAIELEKAILEHKQASIDHVTETAAAKIANGKVPAGEVSNNLELAIKKLYEFFDKGGEVDIVVPEPDTIRSEDQEGTKSPQEVERAELEKIVRSIRKLESDIKRIELDPS